MIVVSDSNKRDRVLLYIHMMLAPLACSQRLQLCVLSLVTVRAFAHVQIHLRRMPLDDLSSLRSRCSLSMRGRITVKNMSIHVPATTFGTVLEVHRKRKQRTAYIPPMALVRTFTGTSRYLSLAAHATRARTSCWRSHCQPISPFCHRFRRLPVTLKQYLLVRVLLKLDF